ncbi:hypothetical protein L9F63_023814, partial [Diploptera punctata]
METTSDTALAERLRREDPEQFHTLVRMHLSFVLDLNTDDCDCASEKAKTSLLQKWNFVPFAKKGRNTSKGVMEGAPLTQEGICQVYQLIEFLSKEQNICQEGIFRRTGKLTRQQELKSLLNQGISLNLDEGLFSVHDCASVLKNFLAELPESLLTDAHYPAYCQIAEMCSSRAECSEDSSHRSNKNRLQQALQLLLLLLPPENRILLKDILQLLHLTANHEKSNKMSADSLATLFTPHLLCPRKLTPEAIHINSQTMSGVVAFMIDNWISLFNIPPKLATDIRAYIFERERRKVSPKKELNESVSDSTAANTVFSFVDREQTALAHTTNPTEAALAQLYAHIQSLPESSKKKRLIKQFNKENGQGTPLKVNTTRKKHHRSKSLGDSIKKHIFNKGLKRQKNCTGEVDFVSRSVSQEEISKPGSCIRLFHKNTEDDSLSQEGTFKSINSTNCVLQSQLSDKTSEAVLKNLASQISAKYQGNKVNELCSSSSVGTRKRLSPSTNSETTCENNSSCKVRCSSPDQDTGSNDKLTTPRNVVACFLSTSTPASQYRLRGTVDANCVLTPIADENNSMSPITRSTQKMPKAMQETMMTPRCRKPVVLVSGSNLCHLANLNNLESRQKRQCTNSDSCNSEEDLNMKDESLSRSCDNMSTNNISVLSEVSERSCEDDSESGSLTSTFRSYLINRSVLTASPVDLSFSSRTGDFDSSEDKILGSELLSESLLYCLDGNTPSAMEKDVNVSCETNTQTTVSLSNQIETTKEYGNTSVADTLKSSSKPCVVGTPEDMAIAVNTHKDVKEDLLNATKITNKQNRVNTTTTQNRILTRGNGH